MVERQDSSITPESGSSTTHGAGGGGGGGLSVVSTVSSGTAATSSQSTSLIKRHSTSMLFIDTELINKEYFAQHPPPNIHPARHLNTPYHHSSKNKTTRSKKKKTNTPWKMFFKQCLFFPNGCFGAP